MSDDLKPVFQAVPAFEVDNGRHAGHRDVTVSRRQRRFERRLANRRGRIPTAGGLARLRTSAS